MGFFSSYILSVVGVILLGVMVDLVLVDGQVKKYIKSIYVLFIIFSLVAPLPKLVDNIKKGEFSIPTSDVEINDNYFEIILNQKNQALAKAITLAFENEGFEGVKVEIEATYENEYTLNKIIIDTSNLNYRLKEERIISIVQNAIKVDKEIITINEWNKNAKT